MLHSIQPTEPAGMVSMPILPNWGRVKVDPLVLVNEYIVLKF